MDILSVLSFKTFGWEPCATKARDIVLRLGFELVKATSTSPAQGMELGILWLSAGWLEEGLL
jgi:hypothetical protein